jgi:hypothetical protein
MHCYTRFTQIKNRCIMGGKGRGVFSDFRLGRVCILHVHKMHRRADELAVPIPNQCARWKSAGCKEGQLVKRRRLGGLCVLFVDHCKATHLIGRRLYMECDMAQQLPSTEALTVTGRCFSIRTLTWHGRSKRVYIPHKRTRLLNKYIYHRVPSTTDHPPINTQAQQR